MIKKEQTAGVSQIGYEVTELYPVFLKISKTQAIDLRSYTSASISSNKRWNQLTRFATNLILWDGRMHY